MNQGDMSCKCNGSGFINDPEIGNLVCDCTFRKAGFGKKVSTRKWEPITGSSLIRKCMFCGVDTSMHFYTHAHIDKNLGMVRLWAFCSDGCVNKYKDEVDKL